MHFFIVCGRNVALGVFPTMEDAITSLRSSLFAPRIEKIGEYYAEATTIAGEVFTVVQCRASVAPEPLFRHNMN